MKDAGLTTLKVRIERGDAIETFKTLKGLNGVNRENWFEKESESSRATRRNTEVTEEGDRRSDLLKVEAARLENRKNFFNLRATRAWNDISEAIKDRKSVNAFKNAYDVWKRDGKSSQC